jgi:hypothetical protein
MSAEGCCLDPRSLTEKERNQGFKANGHSRCDAATTAIGTMTSIEMIRYPSGNELSDVAIIAPY